MDLELDWIDKELLLFVGTNKVKYSDMLNHLVNEDLDKRICNKVPFLRHRRKLVEAGWLKHERPFYFIPASLHSELRKLQIKTEIKDRVDEIDDVDKLETLRRGFEKFVQTLHGSSLAWGISVSLSKEGQPLIHIPNIGPELGEATKQKVTPINRLPELQKIRDIFWRFLKENCERCEYGAFSDEVPIQWCHFFNREIQPKEFNPAIFADGCKYLKKKKGL